MSLIGTNGISINGNNVINVIINENNVINEKIFMTLFPLASVMDALDLFAYSLNLLSLYANITTHMQTACGGIAAKILQP
jgi:hypothetical protein